MNNLSNLIIPRINVNSDSSIDEAIELIKEFNFDAFILFATEKVVFKEDAKFSLERFNFMKEKLQNNSKNKITISKYTGKNFIDVNLFLFDLNSIKKTNNKSTNKPNK